MSSLSENPRHVVFFGETGVGKSSAINLLLEAGTSAPVSNDDQPCTQVATGYETTLNGVKYALWDTRGLGERPGLFRNVLGIATSAENDLKRFLKERHQRHEIDLLVYCVRGSRAIKALAKYYNDFCAITRQLAAPVVLLVTQLEREATNMEEWWNRNFSALEKLKMEFDGHACITTLPGHTRIAEFRERLVDLITKKRRWQAQHNGSYFGSPVWTSIPSAPPPRGGPFRSLLKDGARNHGPSHSLGSPTAAGSTRSLSYYTVESPGSSMPSSPVVEPPGPFSTIAEPIQIPRINTNLLGVDRSRASGGGTSSMGSSPYSLYTSPSSTTALYEEPFLELFEPPTPSSAIAEFTQISSVDTDLGSAASHIEVPLELLTDDTEDHLISEVPFRHSASSTVRRKNDTEQHGPFGDIWECELILGELSPSMVAVKVVKLDTDNQGNLGPQEKMLRRELRIWARLHHQNIVPLLGIVSDFGPLPSTLGDVAVGLSYLHSNGITHGDMHSDNVLINDDGRACLTDLGHSLVCEFVQTSYLTSSMCGAVLFADPALFRHVHELRDDPVISHPTKPCDVYSFGGLLLHVLSEKKPFDGVSHTDIFLGISKGERPRIPVDGEHTAVYEPLIQMCWDRDEHKRPSADELVVIFAQHTTENARFSYNHTISYRTE